MSALHLATHLGTLTTAEDSAPRLPPLNEAQLAQEGKSVNRKKTEFLTPAVRIL